MGGPGKGRAGSPFCADGLLTSLQRRADLGMEEASEHDQPVERQRVDHPSAGEGRIWVVGMDASLDAQRALIWAINRAAAARANGHLIHIKAVSAWSIPLDTSLGLAGAGLRIDWNTDWDEVGRANAARLTELVESIDHQGVSVSPVMVQGNTVQVLFAEAIGAEMLVVGRRGMSALKELVLGSVSRHLVTHAPIPTVVVPPEADPTAPLRRVVVGFDYSSNAQAAVRWVQSMARDLAEDPSQVELDVICAEEISPLTDEATTRERFPDEVARHEMEFDAQVQELDPEGDLHWQFALTSARRALIEHSESAGLTVIGARGRGAVGSAILGSVATWMLHHCTSPLAVVPETEPS
jgi:nucleotide-binding universal stress UspA family protein